VLDKPLPNTLRAYRNTEWGYSLPVPDEWLQGELDVEGGQGVVFTPDADDLTTSISIELRDLGTEVTESDLPDLEKGFLKGLRSVPGSSIDSHESFASIYHIGIDAQQTYDDGGQRRRRWIRLLYKGSKQARLIAQGATVEEFDRLRPLFAPCLTTFLFGEIWPGSVTEI
jgi:hypothetical protein